MVESRPYWLQGGYAECEEPGCAEGLAEAWSALVDADNASNGSGWALAIPIPRVRDRLGTTPPLVPGIPHPAGSRSTCTSWSDHGLRTSRNMHI